MLPTKQEIECLLFMYWDDQVQHTKQRIELRERLHVFKQTLSDKLLEETLDTVISKIKWNAYHH